MAYLIASIEEGDKEEKPNEKEWGGQQKGKRKKKATCFVKAAPPIVDGWRTKYTIRTPPRTTFSRPSASRLFKVELECVKSAEHTDDLVFTSSDFLSGSRPNSGQDGWHHAEVMRYTSGTTCVVSVTHVLLGDH